MEEENTSQPSLPYGLLQNQVEWPTPGDIYPVDTTSLWREERAWCLQHSHIEPHQSLVYHFSDGSQFCCYDYFSKTSHGDSQTLVKMVPAGNDPHRWAWLNNVPYSRVSASSDASVCLCVKALAAQSPPCCLVGWSISCFLEEPVPVFVQKRNAGSLYFSGEIGLAYMENVNAPAVVNNVGTLDEAVVALKYVKQVLGIPIARALAELNAFELDVYQDELAEGYDFPPYSTSGGLQGSLLQKEAARYPKTLVQPRRPGEDEDAMTAQDYIDEFKHASCMDDEQFDEYIDSVLDKG